MEKTELRFFVHSNPERRWYGFFNSKGIAKVVYSDGRIVPLGWTEISYKRYIEQGHWIAMSRQDIIKYINEY